MNIAAVLDRNALRWPDVPALIEGGTSLTYSALQQRVVAAATHLRIAGIRAGDVVGVAVRSGLLNSVLLFAAVRIGAVCCTLDWRARPAEHEAVAAMLRMRAILGDRRSEAAVPVLLVLPDWQSMPASESASLADLPGSAPAVLLLSSGTTGRPKAVAVSHEAASWRALLRQAEMQMPRGHRVLMPMALSATTAVHGLLGQMLAGATTHFFPAMYSPEELYEALLSLRIEQTTVVPTVARWLLGLPWQGRLLLPDIAAFRVVGAAFHAHEKQAVMERITPNLFESYGSAGAGFITMATPGDLRRRPTSVGLPSLSVDLEIVDEKGRAVAAGTTGRVRVRCPTMASGFVGDTAAGEREERFADGWHYPGDLGWVDAQGYVYLEGRAASLIIRGGQNIYPEEIERALLQHTAVAEAAVIGRSDATLGEVPEALLVLRSPATESELLGHCRTRLQSYKVPVAIRIVAGLPRNATGKIDRAALMQQAPGTG